jgi:hypothetical protein
VNAPKVPPVSAATGPASPTASEMEAAVTPCPKCQTPLIDPNGLGWCRSCGYCKSLEDDKARVPLANQPPAPQASALGLVEFADILAKLPRWVWVLLGGIAAIVVLNLPLARTLAEKPLPRAVCSTVEMFLGLLMIFVAQTWALCILAPGDDKLNFKDALLPGRLWGMTLRKLPAMHLQVWLASWGLACILAAVFVTGGQGHWLKYLPKTAETPPPVEQPQ